MLDRLARYGPKLAVIDLNLCRDEIIALHAACDAYGNLTAICKCADWPEMGDILDATAAFEAKLEEVRCEDS